MWCPSKLYPVLVVGIFCVQVFNFTVSAHLLIHWLVLEYFPLSFIDGCLSIFHISACLSDAALSIHAQVCMEVNSCITFGNIRRRRSVESYPGSLFNVLGMTKSFTVVVVTFYSSTSTFWSSQFLLILTHACITTTLASKKWLSYWVFQDLVSEKYFLCTVDICVFLWSFCLIGLLYFVCFYHGVVITHKYMFWYKVFIDIYDCHF